MAHMHLLRELQARLSILRERLPLACVLCRSRAPGGLCVYCRHAVTASMEAAGLRCVRCDLGLAAASLLPTHCPDCSAWSPALERVVAAFDYAWPGDLLIKQLKLQSRYASAPMLAGLLAQRLRSAGACRPADCSVPPTDDAVSPTEHDTALFGSDTLVTVVPASRHSLQLRGFNAAGEVARALARRLRMEWRPDLITRAREGRHQKGLGRRSRHQGVAGMYECAGAVHGREILIVDDVMTTGSTLDAVGQALKAQGAARVCGAVLARTPSRATE